MFSWQTHVQFMISSVPCYRQIYDEMRNNFFATWGTQIMRATWKTRYKTVDLIIKSSLIRFNKSMALFVSFLTTCCLLLKWQRGVSTGISCCHSSLIVCAHLFRVHYKKWQQKRSIIIKWNGRDFCYLIIQPFTSWIRFFSSFFGT